MAFLDTTPRIADSDNNLLFKIAQELSNRNGGAHPPRLADTDNNLLYKIAQLIILGGGTVGTCAADLAACNALTASLQAQIASQQDMLISWTPTSVVLGERAGFYLDVNAPTLQTLIFRASSNPTGFLVAGQSTLSSISFPNLTTNPSGGSIGLSIQSNSALTSLSFPLLTSSLGTFTLIGNALPSIVFPVLSTSAGITITTHASLTSISFPALTAITVGTLSIATGNTALATVSAPLLVTYNGALSLAARTALTSVDFNSLVSSPTSIVFSGCTSLTTLAFPALVTGGTAAGGFSTNGSTSLTTLTLPNWLPSNTRPLNFGTCALNQASVDLVLARAVANAAYVSGTITLNGGTNSTPSAAGLINKGILVGRGVTVLNN